jgi:hypothetical protein
LRTQLSKDDERVEESHSSFLTLALRSVHHTQLVQDVSSTKRPLARQLQRLLEGVTRFVPE